MGHAACPELRTVHLQSTRELPDRLPPSSFTDEERHRQVDRNTWVPLPGLELGFLTSVRSVPQGAPSFRAGPAVVAWDGQGKVAAGWQAGTTLPLSLLSPARKSGFPFWLLFLSPEKGACSLPGWKLGAPRLSVETLLPVLEHWDRDLCESPASPMSIQTQSSGSSSCLFAGSVEVEVLTFHSHFHPHLRSPSPLSEQLLCASHCFIYIFSFNP